MAASTRRRASPLLFRWDPLMQGLDGLGRLWAVSGNRVVTATYDRGGTTGAASSVDVNGTVYIPGYKRPRFYHAYDSTSGLWTPRGVLLEGSRANSALGACSWSDATYWANAASYTITTATSIIAGQTAYKHTLGTNTARTQTIGVFVNGQTDCASAIVENVDNNDRTSIGIRDLTAAAWLVLADFTWSTKAIAITGGSGTCGVINLGNGRYRIWVTGTGTGAGTGAAGNTRSMRVYPVDTATAGLSTIVHHAQFEANTSFPSSPIVTVAAAVTRSADAGSFTYNVAPCAGTWYVKFVEWTTLSASNERVVEIGNGSGARLSVYRNATGYTALLHDGSTSVTGTVTLAATIGDTVELRLSVASTGALTLAGSLNAATEVVGSASSALTLPSAWSGATLTVGADGAAANKGYGAYALLKQHGTAAQSLATMRAL